MHWKNVYLNQWKITGISVQSLSSDGFLLKLSYGCYPVNKSCFLSHQILGLNKSFNKRNWIATKQFSQCTPRKQYGWDNKIFIFYPTNKNSFLSQPHLGLDNKRFIKPTKLVLLIYRNFSWNNQNLVGTTKHFCWLYNNQTFCCPNQTVYSVYS